MEGSMILQGLTAAQLKEMLREVVAGEVAKALPKEDEILLSPKEARAVFKPAISLTTLAAWTKEGRLTAHYFGDKKFYKRSELIASAEVLKPYKKP